jgi:hypothetical protein
MSTPSASRTNRLRDLLGAAVVAVGVCFTLTADARPEPSSTNGAQAAPLALRLREANDSLRRLASPEGGGAGFVGDADKTGVRWGNYFGNFNPWRNWNNWPNWHNFNQWHNF